MCMLVMQEHVGAFSVLFIEVDPRMTQLGVDIESKKWYWWCLEKLIMFFLGGSRGGVELELESWYVHV